MYTLYRLFNDLFVPNEVCLRFLARCGGYLVQFVFTVCVIYKGWSDFIACVWNQKVLHIHGKMYSLSCRTVNSTTGIHKGVR